MTFCVLVYNFFIPQKGAYKLGYLVGGGVQGRIFEDIETGFFAIIHICDQLTFMTYTFLALRGFLQSSTFVLN